MPKKILVITTLECYKVKNTIFDSQNNREDRIKIESCHDKVDMLTLVKSKTGDDLNQYISNNSNFKKFLNETFNKDTYLEFLSEFSAQTFSGKNVFVLLTHLVKKPKEFDLMVGYVVPESLFDLQHLEEHEGISQDNAKKLLRAHNDVLRSNSKKFDVFIDGESLDEVIKILSKL